MKNDTQHECTDPCLASELLGVGYTALPSLPPVLKRGISPHTARYRMARRLIT